MRYLASEGEIAWKATVPGLLFRIGQPPASSNFRRIWAISSVLVPFDA
jgi:hypothetical protein